MIRPGPPWIERNTAPGGVVLQVYALELEAPGGHLKARWLMTRALPDIEAADRYAAVDGELVASMIAADAPVVLVVYDGDTGERMKPQGLAGGR